MKSYYQRMQASMEVVSSFGFCRNGGSIKTDLGDGVCVDCWDRRVNTHKTEPRIMGGTTVGRPQKVSTGDYVRINRHVLAHASHIALVLETPDASIKHGSYQLACNCGKMRYLPANRFEPIGEVG